MNDFSDQQLLRDYAARRSETAFAELVRRHVDHVHSAALRMVRDAHLAQDVTQGAFVALAQNAGSLTERPILSGWLHRTAQNLAANAVRTEVRRRARETEAVAMNEIFAAEPDARWEHIAPHLDDALGELGEADRDALLLRYFERKSASEMARTLGISDEAAQKRVNRAVEKLRDIFAKRKISVGAGGLAVVIAANAVQAAPAGLAATISAAAILTGTAVSTSTIIAATKTIAMTTLQKTVITTALVAAAGAGIFEARQAAQLREQNQTLQQAQAPLAEQNQQLQRERDDAMNRLAELQNELAKANKNHLELLKLRGEIGQLKSAANSEELREAGWLVQDINLLKNYFSQNPTASTPELQFLDKADWVRVMASSELGAYGFDQAKVYRHDASRLRSKADEIAGWMFRNALEAYKDKNQGQYPSDIRELKTYFKKSSGRSTPNPDIENVDGILDRWKIVPANQVKGAQMGGDVVITQKAAVDDLLDDQVVVGQGICVLSFVHFATFNVLKPVREAYHAAKGSYPENGDDLLRYATTPEQMAAVKQYIQKETWSAYQPEKN